jgi:DNA-binding MarR family transcriptional regulator
VAVTTPTTKGAGLRADGEELSAQLGETIVRIARRLRRSSTRSLEPFGLSDSEARVLRLIARSDSPLRMSEIAKKIEVVPRSATTVVAGLEAKGLANREIAVEDRRSILVRPTKAGLRLVADLGRARAEAAVALFGRLDPTDRVELLRILSGLLPDAAVGNTRQGDGRVDPS